MEAGRLVHCGVPMVSVRQLDRSRVNKDENKTAAGLLL